MPTERVFVYGTLRPPGPDTPADDCRYYRQIAAHVRAACPARLSSAILYDMGTYPAARPGNGLVHGELLTVAPEALAIMDRIEGHPGFYRRSRVHVNTASGLVAAWIYWAPEGLAAGRQPLASGDWFQRTTAQGESTLQPLRETDPPETRPEVAATLLTLVRRFAECMDSWLTSVQPAGHTHTAAVRHVWQAGRPYVVTGSGAREVQHILHQPRVVLSCHDPAAPILIQGWATLAPAMQAQLRPLFTAKYGQEIDQDEQAAALLEVTPTMILAWNPRSAGRWPGSDAWRIQSA